MSTYDIGEITVYIVADTGAFERGLSRTRDTMTSFQRSMQIAAGVLMRDLFYGFIGVVQEATELGAQVQTLKNSFESFTDAADAQWLTLDRLRAATSGMVSDVDLLTQANRMLAAGLPVNQVEELFSGAIKLGKAMGIDASMAIEKLTLGLVRMSWRLMDDLGIIMRSSTANEEYAKAIGTTAAKLNAEQKQLAWVIYGTKELTERVKILGDNVSDADKSLDQFTASLKNVYTAVGENLAAVPALNTAVNTLAPAIGIVLAQQFAALNAAALAAGHALTGFQAVAAMGAAVTPWMAVGTVIALLPTAIKGYGMALHDLRMATDEVYRAQQNLIQSTEELSDLEQRADAAATALQAARGNVADAYRALVSAADAYADALGRQEDAERRLEEAQRVKTIAYADFVAALNYAKGVTETYHAVQADLTWATKDAEATYLSLRDTLWGLEEQYASLSDQMKELTEADEDTTLQQMQLRLQMDQLQLAYDKGNVKRGTYERNMKRLRRMYDELSITQQKNRIEQFKLRDEMDDAQSTMDETQGKIDTLTTADDQYEQSISDVLSSQSELIESTQEVASTFTSVQSALDTYKQAQWDLADAYTAQALAADEAARATANLAKEAQAAYEAEQRRKAEEEEEGKGREPGTPKDDTTPGYVEPSTPGMEPTTYGGGSQSTFSPTSNSTVLSISIGQVVGTDKKTAEKTGEAVLDYVTRGLRARGVVVR